MFETRNAPVRLPPGQRLATRWSGITVTVDRRLGEGANGSVYLARLPGISSRCALKIGNDAYGLQSEINALNALGVSACKLLFADDVEWRGGWFPSYAMTFVPGIPLGKLPRGNDFALWIACGASLLERLRELHQAGWAFGDLKPENVIVGRDGQASLIDFGGATPFGQAVKQFTERYDRGYWKAGGRRAEAAYDLFSFAVVMLEAAGNGRRLRAAAYAPEGRNAGALVKIAEGSGIPPALLAVLKRMLSSGFPDTEAACRQWSDAVANPAARGRRARDFARNFPALWFAGAVISFVLAAWWTVR